MKVISTTKLHFLDLTIPELCESLIQNPCIMYYAERIGAKVTGRKYVKKEIQVNSGAVPYFSDRF